MNKSTVGAIAVSIIIVSLCLWHNYEIMNLYERLQKKHDNLLQEHARLELLHELYNASYERLKYETRQRAYSPNPCIFITPDDLSVDQKVREITGGWSNSSDLTEFWYDIQEIFNWVEFSVRDNYDTYFPVLPSEPWGRIEYVDEVWLFPNETLTLGGGDCEDQALLLCSMILSYQRQNPKFPVECIHLVGWDLVRNSIKGHLAVQISFEGKLTLLDTAGWLSYSTSDHTGKLTAKNVSTEINRYFEHHLIDLGANITVYRVFSNLINKHFNSTHEYIQWMENRQTS